MPGRVLGEQTNCNFSHLEQRSKWWTDLCCVHIPLPVRLHFSSSPLDHAALTMFRFSGSCCLNTFRAGSHRCHSTKTVLVNNTNDLLDFQSKDQPSGLFQTLQHSTHQHIDGSLKHFLSMAPRAPSSLGFTPPSMTASHLCTLLLSPPHCWLRSQPLHLSISTPTHGAISSSPRPILLSVRG